MIKPGPFLFSLWTETTQHIQAERTAHQKKKYIKREKRHGFIKTCGIFECISPCQSPRLLALLCLLQCMCAIPEIKKSDSHLSFLLVIAVNPVLSLQSKRPYVSLLFSSLLFCLFKFQVVRWWVRLHYPRGLSGAGPGSAWSRHRRAGPTRRWRPEGVQGGIVVEPRALGRCR